MIIEKGTLKSFLLDLYGSNKTGFPKAENMGDCYIIEPGDVALEEMIRPPVGSCFAAFQVAIRVKMGILAALPKTAFVLRMGKLNIRLMKRWYPETLFKCLIILSKSPKSEIMMALNVYHGLNLTALPSGGNNFLNS